ncbi:MAG: hypothetical protein QM809_04490 [Gordonia sp. (in: high G+C Gram-positive bacteria)]|uniref:hypothetical protein n=1 Tax=Gordonia sp. (in: high G+C Gram-positive bacteria) TaxID=84139 RepID=UPI0039E30CD3
MVSATSAGTSIVTPGSDSGTNVAERSRVTRRSVTSSVTLTSRETPSETRIS